MYYLALYGKCLPTMIEEKEDTNAEKLGKQEKEADVPMRRLV